MKPQSIHKIPLVYIRGRRTNNQLGDASWELDANMSITLSSGDIVIIPKGFKTDLSSIPEFWWGIQKPFGDFILAPIVHDWMYRTHYREEDLGTYSARMFADKEMLIISKATNSEGWYNRLDNHVRYLEVRLLGWYTYNNRLK